MNTECVQGIVIDLCAKSFLLMSDEGSERKVQCDTTEEFMNVLEVVTSNLNPDQIRYAGLSVANENTHD